MFDDLALVLSFDSAGKWQLVGRVTAPNNGFDHGSVIEGAPAGSIGIPEDIHLMLELKVVIPPVYLQVPTPVNFVKVLDPKAFESHTRLVAHLMLNGAELSRQVIGLPANTNLEAVAPKRETNFPDFVRMLTPPGYTPYWDGNLPWPLRAAQAQ